MNQVAHSTTAPCSTMDVFAENVKELMELRGITMAELARQSNKDRSTLHKSLNGQGGSFNLNTCDAIADALGTTTVELLKKK